MLFLLPPCFSGSSEGKRGSGQSRLELHVKGFWRRQQLRGFLLVSYIRFLFPLVPSVSHADAPSHGVWDQADQ